MKKLLLILSLLALPFSSAYCEVGWKPYPYFKLDGGLNDGFSDIDIADNEFTDVQNVVFTTSGNVKTRDGYSKVNTTAVGSGATCTGITFFKLSSGTKYLVSIWTDNKIYKMDYDAGGGPDGTWDDITGSLSFTVTATDLASFAVAEDTLIIEDGVNTTAPYKWTGTGNAAALGGNPPNASFVVYNKRIAYLGGNNTYPSLLYFCDPGDIENWSTGLSGNWGIDTNDGSILRGAKVGFDAIYPFKDNSIFRLSGTDKDSFVLQKMVSDKGTVSGLSVSLIGTDFIFQSAQGGIYLYDGAVKLRKISSKIDGTIDGIAFDRLYYYPSLIYDDDYYLAYTSAAGTTNSGVLVFDTFHLVWTKFDGLNVSAWCVGENSEGKEAIFFGDYSGFVYEYPSGTNDAGTAIADYAVTKQYRFSELSPEKYLRLLTVFANQKGDYNLNVEVRTDYEGTGTAYSISLLGESSLYDVALYDVDAYGGQNLIVDDIRPDKGTRFFQLKFYNDNADEPWELKGHVMHMEESDRI